jgi:hypothetical protein
MPETVLMNQPRITAPGGQGAGLGAQPTWNNTPQYNAPAAAKKSSKTWLWVVGILGIVVLLCGGGFAGLVFIGMNIDDNSSAGPSNTATPANTRSLSNSPASTSTTTGDVQDVDLSEWVRDFSIYGTTEFTDGEFFMASKQKGFYYVLVAPEDYSTDGASTKVTLRNVDDANSTLGYGLIFHSDPNPLTQDYAFLIDTKKKRYRVVHHEPQKESSIVNWTNSPLIKEGTQENILEARDKGEKTELYINGQLVNSVDNKYRYKGGVVGLYSGDAAKIAFKDMEIVK